MKSLVSLNFIIIFIMNTASDPNINQEGYPIDLDFGKFKFIKSLASGGQGVVCLYRSLPHKDVNPPFPELVAVKLDPSTDNINLKETLWLRD